MELSELEYIKLKPDTVIPEFICTDKDLNEFLTATAKEGLEAMVSVTYLFIDPKPNNSSILHIAQW